jgi:hypothetical protein
MHALTASLDERIDPASPPVLEPGAAHTVPLRTTWTAPPVIVTRLRWSDSVGDNERDAVLTTR